MDLLAVASKFAIVMMVQMLILIHSPSSCVGFCFNSWFDIQTFIWVTTVCGLKSPGLSKLSLWFVKTPVRIKDTFQDAAGNLKSNGDTKILIVKDRRVLLPFTSRRPRAGGLL
jgi:hypothetical protein